MAKQEAKVRVRLDTKQAKGELRGLVRESARAAGRVAGGVRSAVGKGLGVVGLGAGIGTGIAAVRGATSSGLGDVVGESLGGIGAQISEFFLGDLDDKARASKSAREETIQAFGAIAGATGSIPPNAKAFYDNVHQLRTEEEKGRTLFETNENFRGPGIKAVIDKIMEGIGTLISGAVETIVEKIGTVDRK